ncbi:MAG TPA: NmrA/HSCARG family protein [Thermoleophilia bacterium]
MTAQQTILVAGATGQQGGAVVRHLRDDGFAVRALTRDPDGDKARALRADGIEVAHGDLTDAATLGPALEGAYGVFSMATPFEQGMEAEVRQGTTLGDAAKAAGIQHYVYSSVGGAERQSGVPHFDTKWQVEEHLRALGLPLTIVRPVYFFENFGGWGLQPNEGGQGYTLAMPLSPETTLQSVAVDDIGAAVAKAFATPAESAGRAFELAGDELSLAGYAAAISRDLGVPVGYFQVPWEAVKEQNEDIYLMYKYFEREGYQSDIAALRAEYPGLHTFAQWLAEGGLGHLRKAA